MPKTPFRAALAVCILSLPLAASAQTVSRITEAPTIQQETTLSFTVTGKSDQAPDIAFVTTGVMVEAPTAREAMRNNAARMANVVEALKKAGVEARDVQTSNLTLSPRYDYRQNESPRLVGYTASNAVTIKVRDLANLGATLDTLVDVGANEINGISFALTDPDAAMQAARERAMTEAKARADFYARASGMRVKRIVTLTENGGWNEPRPQMMMARAVMDMAESAPTPIEGGSVSYSVTLSLTYELE